jgi:predicted Zn-dependent protease
VRLRHFIVFSLLLLAGALGGVFLVTGKSEVALIHFRDKDFDTALRQYEQRLATGDASVSVVMPLCQLYLQYGNVEGAIALMERFVRQHPTDIDALQLLANYFQYAQREDEYLRTLEVIAAANPTGEIERELSEMYSFRAEFDKQIKVLKTLTDRNPSSPDDFIDLANLQAARGQLKDAAMTLEALEATHPATITAETVQFFIGILLDSGQSEKAVQRSKHWLSGHPNAEDAARFASLISSRDQHQQAINLLEPYEAAADKNPIVLSVLTEIEVANNMQDRALKRLDRLNAAGILPDSALEAYLDLLLGQGKSAEAFAAAEKRDLKGLPDWLLANLVRASLDENRLDFATYLTAKLGEDFLEGFPVLGARLELACNNSTGASRWINKAESRQLTKADKLDLVSIYNESGRKESAIHLLEGLVEDPQTSDSTIRDLATFYLDTGEAARGLRLYRRLKNKRHTSEVDKSWALLEAAAGAEKDVVDWFGTTTERLEPDFLENLYFLANDSGKKTLALASIGRLYKTRGDDEDRLRLAEALYASGRPADALDHLRVLVPKGGAESETLYAEVLTAVEKKGGPVREELRVLWSKRLTEAGSDEKKQEDAAQALFDLGAYEAALPTLAKLAHRDARAWQSAYVEAATKANRKTELVGFLRSELNRTDLSDTEKNSTLELLREYGTDADALPYVRELAELHGGEWTSAYEDLLQRLGKRADLVAFWQLKAHLASTPTDERRGIAFRSLDAGEKDLAENIFWSLADGASAGSGDVSQLLFIWGPRPKRAALDWLDMRARTSTGAERAAWVEHLINAGAASRAVKAFQGDELTRERLKALAAAGDASGFAELVERKLPDVHDSEALRELGKYALELNVLDVARDAYTKLLSLRPDDAEALRRAGNLDYVDGRFAEAKDRLGRYLSGSTGDPESHFYYGELLQQDGTTTTARGHFETALAQIEGAGQKTFQMKTIHALALYRLGRLKDSIAEFESLIKDQPNNKHLRADYASVLIQSGRHNDAQRLLDEP